MFKEIETTEIPATFADFLEKEIRERDISTFHEAKLIEAFKLVAKSEPGPWRDTLTTIIKFNPTAFVKVCGGCFERSLREPRNDN